MTTTAITPTTSTAIAAADPLAEELASRWLRFAGLTPATMRTYKAALGDFRRFCLEGGIAKPTREDVAAYRDGMAAEGLKPATIRVRLVAVRLLFSWLASEGLYPNVAERVKLPPRKDRGHKRDYLKAEPLAKVIENAPGRNPEEWLRNKALLFLMSCHGLRAVEVSRADVGDLSTTGGEFTLRIQGKGRAEKADQVALVPQVAAAIAAYLKRRGPVASDAALFASTAPQCRGARLSTRSISGVAKGALRAAGLDSPRLTCHSLRHSAVSLAAQAGATPFELQRFARHSNFQTTQIYLHELEDAANPCAGLVAGALFRALG